MNINIIFFFCISLITSLTKADELAIWNVGQGQFVSIITKSECFHFDMGGNYVSKNKVINFCKDKKNILSFSHWDYDHISFVKQFIPIFQKYCILYNPSGPHNVNKSKIFNNLTICKNTYPKIKMIFTDEKAKTPNKASRVFVYDNKILIPGDSPCIQEKTWSKKLSSQIQFLILGHHGSKTSTCDLLLKKLIHLKLAVGSSLITKYGHPHKELLLRLRNKKVPIITTEKWGNIIIKL